jgi:multisubunit Na+/H+ antiporter MnhB subunit
MSIVGFYISVIWVVKRWPDFGVAFAIVFAVMFIASIISLTYAPANLLLKLERYEREHKGAKEESHADFLKHHKKH